MQLWINVIGYPHGMHQKTLIPMSNPKRPRMVFVYAVIIRLVGKCCQTRRFSPLFFRPLFSGKFNCVGMGLNSSHAMTYWINWHY